MTNTREATAVDRLTADLASGAYFDRHAASQRSVRCYQPPTSRHDWATVITELGKFASSGDEAAQLASAVLRTLPLYQGRHEMAAAAYAAVATAVRDQYDDVIRRSSPEPGRPSTWRRPYSEQVLARLALSFSYCLAFGQVPGPGWVLRAYLEREHMGHLVRS